MNSEVAIDLTGKVALVTGASRGIGRETAILLAKAGARVVINHRQSASDADAVAREIGPSQALVVQADVGDPLAVEELVGRTVIELGRLDILVNNAGTFAHNPFDNNSYESWREGWRRTFDVNILGAANCAYLAIRQMRNQGGGRIINVASRAAFRGEMEFADYGASKAAMVNLTRSIARGCAPDGIISSCVAPGFIDTEMAASEISVRGAEILRQIPLGRIGTATDVAGVILFLSSRFADYLTGVTVDVNGGSWFH
ncbi:MAG: SDR family NAD(P)-dependent oxidoreductase [Acidobacteriota bacterium]